MERGLNVTHGTAHSDDPCFQLSSCVSVPLMFVTHSRISLEPQSAGRKRCAHLLCSIILCPETWCAWLWRSAWPSLVLGLSSSAVGLGRHQSTEFYGQCWRGDKMAIHSECFPRIKEQEENISRLVWEWNK